jgi:iron(III) transport system permease protein
LSISGNFHLSAVPCAGADSVQANAVNWPVLMNSLLVSGLATLLATGGGLLVALAASSSPSRWRRVIVLGTIAALVMPPFLVANCWIDLFREDAAWRTWWPTNWPYPLSAFRFRLYSLGGAAWLLSLLTWPLSALFVLGAWSRLENTQLEIDPAARGWSLARNVLWPVARPVLGPAAVLTFVLALNNFAVPVILQVKVFPEELWLAFTTRLDEAGAWMASLPMIIAPLLLLIVCRRTGIPWPGKDQPATGEAFWRQLRGGCGWTARTLTALLLLLSLGLPLQQLAATKRTWTELPNLFRAAPDTIWNSFLFAALTATLCVLLGLVSWRLRVGPILWLPFLVPGVLLGRAMMAGFEGTLLYGTMGIVIAAYTLRYLAPAWSLVSAARRGVDPDLTDAAKLQGARGWMLFRHVHGPQMAGQLAAAWYATYLLCLWDVETLALIYPPGGETLALRSFNLLHYGHNAQVNALCVVLLGLAVAPGAAWSLGRWLVLRRTSSQ